MISLLAFTPMAALPVPGGARRAGARPRRTRAR